MQPVNVILNRLGVAFPQHHIAVVENGWPYGLTLDLVGANRSTYNLEAVELLCGASVRFIPIADGMIRLELRCE